MSSNRKGWIRLHRSIQDNDLHPSNENRSYTKFEAKLDMIMMANYEPKVIKNVLIERGQFSHSYRFLAKRYKWSLGKVQRFIEHLIRDDFLRRSDTETGTVTGTGTDTPQMVLSVCKYERYQSDEFENDTPTDTLTDTETGTKKKKYNKLKKYISLSDRKLDFVTKCKELNILDDDLKDQFIDHWTEHNEGGKKMKFEMERTWNLSSRMKTWKRNDKKWSNKQNKIEKGKSLQLEDFKVGTRGDILVYCSNPKCKTYGETLFAQNIFDIRKGHSDGMNACGSRFTNVKPNPVKRTKREDTSLSAEQFLNKLATKIGNPNEKTTTKTKKVRKEVYDSFRI